MDAEDAVRTQGPQNAPESRVVWPKQEEFLPESLGKVVVVVLFIVLYYAISPSRLVQCNDE